MPKLAHLLRREDPAPPNASQLVPLLDELFAFNATAGDRMTKDVIGQINALAEAIIATNQSTIERTTREEISAVIETIVRSAGEAAQARDAQISALTERIDALAGGLSRVDSMVGRLPQSIPKTDLGGVESAIRRLENKVARKADIESLRPEETEKPTEWQFEVEREAFSDKIKSVKARAIE